MFGQTFVCFAHRGASGYAPENTLASFEKAIELGAKWIETDVYATDGTLIVQHDPPSEGNRSTLTLPTVFEAIQNRVGLNIELKSKGCAELVVPMIAGKKNIVISSFDH